MGVGVGMAVSMRVWIGGAAGFSTGPTCSLIICEPSARRELGVEINADAAATSIFADRAYLFERFMCDRHCMTMISVKGS